MLRRKLNRQLNQLWEDEISKMTATKCFEEKFLQILEAIEIVRVDEELFISAHAEVLNMITMVIGRLTLDTELVIATPL